MRITALSAGSRTSPEADLERLILWCLGRFQGNVSPGQGTRAVSPSLSSGRLCSLSLSFRVAITVLREKAKGVSLSDAEFDNTEGCETSI